MSNRKIIKLKRIPNRDTLLTLVELMTYHKLSYSVGNKENCFVSINDKFSTIETPEIIYKLSDELYLYLYLLSNTIIANIYKTIDNDQTLYQYLSNGSIYR